MKAKGYLIGICDSDSGKESCVANDSLGTICDSSSCVGLDRKPPCWEAADGFAQRFSLVKGALWLDEGRVWLWTLRLILSGFGEKA